MRFSIALPFCLLAAFPAASATPKARPVFETDGKFGFCLAEKDYDDGRNLTFALSPSDRINLGIMVPKAGFSLGGHYDLALSLIPRTPGEKKAYSRTIRAVAIDANSLVLQMGKNPSFEKALTDAPILGIEAGGKKLEFTLPPMSNVLKDLRTCNNQNRGKTDRVAANVEKAMPEPLKALLIEAGLRDIAPMRMDDIPVEQRPADFIWQTGPLMGGVRERLAPKNKGLNDLTGLYIQGLKNRCSGTFSADVGREELVDSLKLRKADVQCTMKGEKEEKDEAIVGSILFYLTSAGRFTIFTHEARAKDKASAMTARDALHKTITQLAKEMNKEP